MRKVFYYFFLALLLMILVFYFWGKSGSLNNADLHIVELSDLPSHHSQDTFSVMTYNLGYLSGMTNNLPVRPTKDLFQSNLFKARQLINRLQPDIIGFQEIDFASARSYYLNQADSLADGYAVIVKSVNWDKKYVPFPYWPPSVHFGKMVSGQAIFSKFPLLESERMVLPGPTSAPFYYNAFYLDRLIQLAKLSIGETEIYVLNVHLEAFDEATRERQAEEVLNVVDSLVQNYPVILMGDFNARPPFASEKISDEWTMDLFINHPLLSPAVSNTAYLQQESQYFTFDSGTPYEKLDYIFYTPGFIRFISSSTVSEAGEISDHLPVELTFTLLNR